MAFSTAHKIASVIDDMTRPTKDQDVYELAEEERLAVRKGMDAARRGDFAPDDEMDEFLDCIATRVRARDGRPPDKRLSRNAENFLSKEAAYGREQSEDHSRP